MNSRVSTALWLALALACGSALASDEIRWAPDIETAKKAAAKFKVPLLIHFYGDNCLPCKTLEQRVYSRPELVETINKYFICARVNASKERQTAIDYQVHSWPTDVFIGVDGQLLYQGICKQDLNGYLGVLHNVAVMNRDRNTMVAAESKNLQPAQSGLQNQQIPTQNLLPGSNQLGSNRQAASPTSTGFYNSAETVPQQTIPQSQAPRAGVQSGPLTAINQPQPTTNAAPYSPQAAGSQMVAAPPTPQLNQTPAGQLPASPAMVATATGPTSPNHTLAAYGSLPQTARQTALPTKPNYGTTARANTTLLTNPYYPSMPNSIAANNTSNPPAATTQVAKSQQGIPAQQIAFHARESDPPTTASPKNTIPPTKSIVEETAQKPPTTGPTQPAMDGYCVIQAKQGKWELGAPQFAVQHRGQVYWLSSAAAQQQFLANPDKAAPVLSGYDPMILLNEGRLVPGTIHHTLHERMTDQLFLFSSNATKEAYFPAGDETAFEKNTRALLAILNKAAQ